MFSRAFAQQRRANIPPPIIANPSGQFIGNDGSWSTFNVRVGTPGQDAQMLVSTLVPETWAVISGACNAGLNSNTNCTKSRGGTPNLFDSNSSSTWVAQNTYSFAVEGALGISQTTGGNYGYDTLGVDTVGGNGAVLDHQVVSGFATTQIWLGNLGIAPRTSNFEPNNTQTSFLTSLNNANKIPSLSYSYTAGAYYRSKTNASLIFGGYDASRFSFPNVNFKLSADPVNQLMVGLQKIDYSDSNTKTNILSSGILMLLDSTLTNIWLPQDACDKMAAAFGLTYDEYHSQYTINDTQRSTNYQNGASVNFTLGENISGGNTVTINMPYGAFDLNATNPTSSNTNATAYFPLKVASTKDAYVFGRAFFQEAVVTVDFGRQNFTVAQALPITGKTQTNVIPIMNSTTNGGSGGSSSGGSSNSGGNGNGSDGSSDGSGGLSGGAKGGIAVGVIAAFAIAALGVFFWWRKRRAAAGGKAGSDGSADSTNKPGEVAAINDMPLAKGHQDVNAISPPPRYPGAQDYFGAGAKDGISPAHTPGTSTPGHQPLIPHVNQYTGLAEMPSPSQAPPSMATITDLNYQNAYNNGYLSPASVPPSAAGAAGAGAGAVAVAELAGTDARDRPHELHSPASVPRSELASPNLNAHEMPTPTSASISPSPGAVSPNLTALSTTPIDRSGDNVAEIGTTSPIDASAGAAAGSAALAAAATARSTALSAAPESTEAEGHSGAIHRTQRSSATIPGTMQPRIRGGDDDSDDQPQALPPLPANASSNITAAELATRPMSSATNTTWFDEGAVTPSPTNDGHGTHSSYFHGSDSASESGVSRATSIMSATSARIVRPTMVQNNNRRSSSPENTRITTIGEDREAEERENTPEK